MIGGTMRKLSLIILCVASLVATVKATTLTIPNTFTAGTVIDPTQMNTNFSTIVNDYNGSINNNNIAANGVNYSNLSTGVQQIFNYRRPVLQYLGISSTTIEVGLNGTAGQALIVFPDGTARTDSTASHINLDVTRTMALTGTAQSGVMVSTAVTNTWYANYAVKSQVNTTDFVIVASTYLPIQTNFANLNTYFGTNGWVYLGMLCYGDNSGSPGVILNFVMSGNTTKFKNTTTGQGQAGSGPRVASVASGTNATYTYATGLITGSQIPNNMTLVYYRGVAGNSGGGSSISFSDSAAATNYFQTPSGTAAAAEALVQAANGFKIAGTAGQAYDIYVSGFIDNSLGVGGNPGL